MNIDSTYELPEFGPLVSFIDALLSEINIGIIIYHLEDPSDSTSFRLIYANKESCKATGADLRSLVGKPILEAFPKLADTDLPEIFKEIIESAKPRRIGLVTYSDERLSKGEYSVRAFPMPSKCVGVLFENVSQWGGEA